MALPSSHSSVFPTIPSPHRSEVEPDPASPIPAPVPPEASGLSPVLMSVVPPLAVEPAFADASVPSMLFGLLTSSGGPPQRTKARPATKLSNAREARLANCIDWSWTHERRGFVNNNRHLT